MPQPFYYDTEMISEWVDALKQTNPKPFGRENIDLEVMRPRFDSLLKLKKEYDVGGQFTEEILADYSMGELVSQGVPILETVSSVGNTFRKFKRDHPYEALKQVHDWIRQGDTMASPMNNSEQIPRFFSPESVYLTDVGEVTGDLDRCLKKSADILEAKFKHGLDEYQTGDILFCYGLGRLLDAGISSQRALEELKRTGDMTLIGPSPIIIDLMKAYADEGSVADKIRLENFVGEVNQGFDTKYMS